MSVQRGQQGQCGRWAHMGPRPVLKLTTCSPSLLTSCSLFVLTVFAHFVPSQALQSLNTHCQEVCASWPITLSWDLSLGDQRGLSPCPPRSGVSCGRETLGFESGNLALGANFATYWLCAFGQCTSSLWLSGSPSKNRGGCSPPREILKVL